MDLDIEKIHSVLLDANLPSSINDLKNPTEEFVVNLINTFLTSFYIDVSLIDKPTRKQEELICNETSDIVGLINLHVAMVQICDRIFVRDLCITDITSPGSKRFRKQAKFLANFILYATNKQSDIQDRIDIIHGRANMLQEILDKKNEVWQSINDKAMHNAEQLSLKEKYSAEIEKVRSRIEKNNKRYLEVVAKMAAAEEKRENAVQLFESYTTKSKNLSQSIAKLQSDIVKAPEVYHTRLRELEEQQKVKVKERAMMQEAFQDKKHLIEQQENILGLVQKQLEELSEVREVYGNLKQISTQGDRVKSEVDEMKRNIAELRKKLANQEDQCNENKVHEFHKQYEENLSHLRTLHTQLLSEKKLEETKLKREQTRYNEACLEKNKIQCIIKKLEEETLHFIKNCQELYDSAIINEVLWKDSLHG